MHGVNLDQLGGRDPDQYGTFTLPELEAMVAGFAEELGMEASFFQSNHEGEFVEHLHALSERADAASSTRAHGATTRGRSATPSSSAGCPPSRSTSRTSPSARPGGARRSFAGLTIGRIYGKQEQGYREALELIAEHLKK